METENPLNIDQVIQAIENNELVLPTMPDWALELQQILQDVDASTNQIIQAVSRDPVLVAQLIKTANSAIYAGMPKVTDVMAAITRLGHRLLHSMLMRITLAQLSSARHPPAQQRLAAFMEHSQEVAAISYVLAKDQKGLMPDQALLAGMIHDIGVIPICIYADRNGSAMDAEDYDRVIQQYSGLIGEKLLTAWAFPDALVAVPALAMDLQYGAETDPASYADIVTVANLLAQPALRFSDWDSVHAVKRLGMSPESCQEFNPQRGSDVQAVREIFFDNSL